MKSRVLVVDDELSVHETIAEILGRKHYDLRTTLDKSAAERLLATENFDLAIIDLKLSEKLGDESGFDLLSTLKERFPDMPVIVITGYYLQPDMVVKCMRRGAYDYFIKEQFNNNQEKFKKLISEAIKHKPDHNSIEESYPHPIAFLHRECARNVVAHQFKYERLIQLLEVTLKYCAIVCLGEFVQARSGDERIKEYFHQHMLRHPSMGRWNEFIQLFANCAEDFDYHWIPRVTSIFTSRIKKNINELIQLRNQTIGHGATKPEHEYAALVKECEPKIDRLLHNASVLGTWDLFLAKSTKKYSDVEYEHSVLDLKGHSPKFLTPERRLMQDLVVNRVYTRDPKANRILPLHPFLIVALCPQCTHQTIFFYDKFDADMVHYLDYVNGHHHRTLEYYRELKSVL